MKIGRSFLRFKPGQHAIAVKVVGKDGLDNVEFIRLRENEKVTKS
jgi:hypothetical protein